MTFESLRQTQPVMEAQIHDFAIAMLRNEGFLDFDEARKKIFHCLDTMRNAAGKQNLAVSKFVALIDHIVALYGIHGHAYIAVVAVLFGVNGVCVMDEDLRKRLPGMLGAEIDMHSDDWRFLSVQVDDILVEMHTHCRQCGTEKGMEYCFQGVALV